MHLEIFVYLLCRFPGENRIYTVQRENSFTSGALPRNWLFGLVIEDRSCKNWHSDSFPVEISGLTDLLLLYDLRSGLGDAAFYEISLNFEFLLRAQVHHGIEGQVAG